MIADINRLAAWFLDKPTDEPRPVVLAGDAKALKHNNAYQQARENIVRRILSDWIASKAEDFQRREQLYQEICALGRVQTELNLFVYNQEREQDNA